MSTKLRLCGCIVHGLRLAPVARGWRAFAVFDAGSLATLMIRLLFCLCLCTGRAGADEVATNSSNWAVRVWQSDDGLPNNIVTGLAQTPDGYLWVANPTRLARFDGVQFEEFPSGDLTGNRNQRITTLATGRDGTLWLATDHGVVSAVKAGAVRVFTNNASTTFVETMVEDAEGALWVKDRGGEMICRIAGGEMTQLPMPGSYRSVAVDSRGRIWFANNGNVGLYRDGKFETLAQPLLRVTSARMTGAKNGGVWVCLGPELFKMDENSAPVSCGRFNAQLASTDPTVLLEDHAGAVWIGTSDSGLFRYSDGKFESIPVSHHEILSLLEDREGNIWAGTGGGGLNQIQPRAVTLEGTGSGLPYETLQSICQDTNGNVWAATGNGLLMCRAQGNWRVVSSETNWPGGRAACVAADASGAIWVGTRNRRLYCLRNGEYTTWQETNGIVSRGIHVLLPDSHGDVWLAGNAPNAIQRLHNGRLETIHVPVDLDIVHAVVETSDGTFWVGTSRGTLLSIRNDLATDETARAPGAPMSIRSLQTTRDGTLWIGYAGAGLGRMKDGKYTRITAARGLFDDHISQILADDRGWIWLGSDHGIFKIRQQQAELLAEKQIDRIISVHYGPGDGLPGLQATYGEAPGVLHGLDGRLWMPMRTGLAVINPAALREDAQAPPVLLKQVVVDDRVAAQFDHPVPSGDGAGAAGTRALRLPPDHRHLEFDYTATSFDSPGNIRFQYQLQGFDNNWVEAGTERHAIYSRLAAGTYHFLVRACNSDGAWGAAGAGMSFVVAPFFWQTWWFWGVTAALFASLVAALVRFVSHRSLHAKVQMLERQAALDRERTRIARDIHDDIGNMLTQVTLLSSLTLRDRSEPEKTLEHARQISTAADQMASSLDEIVWAVNPRNDTLPQLVDYIGQFAVEFLQTAGIPCQVDLPDHPPHRAVSTDVRHNLFLVVKEALNNVARHSGAREVSLRVVISEQNLEVAVQDNGHGFDPASVNGSSNGLRNMRQRIAELGGTFLVESDARRGTRILLQLPWQQQNRIH